MRLRRPRLASVGLSLAILALTLVNLDAFILQRAATPPPSLAPRPPPPPLIIDGDTRRLGPCWWRAHHGQHVLYLEGDAFASGYCNSALAGSVMGRQEAALHRALDQFVPNALAQRLLLDGVMWVYRDLGAALRPSEREEIFGIAAGYADPFGDKGPRFPRLVLYHALHDISQALIDNPLIACSALAASGEATADGHTLLARNFDFEADPIFDTDKVILFHRPDEGLGYVSVVWSGAINAVSGMNEARIGVSLNAAGSDELAVVGTPTTVLLRRVLMQARSLDDAVEIMTSAPTFVTDIITLADGKTGEVRVLEISPRRHAQRHAARGLIWATNHLLHPTFAADQENQKRLAEGTTGRRFERLGELLAARHGRLSVEESVAILRDRRLPGGRPAPLGHRGTLDAMIASHSVVFDLTSLTLWVSSAPHTLGPYVPYDLEAVLAGLLVDHAPLPADPELRRGWPQLQRARAAVAQGEDAPPREALA
ncbi:C45 family peptidase, partial [Myxococcota bacterium]|nr:C45 family peptidase [Myxococcota bacterium]